MESKGLDDARASLDAVAAARTGTADRLVTPWWYHPVLGLLVAQHVLAQGLDDSNWTLPSALLLLGGCLLLVLAYRRLTGLTAAGAQGPRSRSALILLALVAMACVLGASVADNATISWGAAAVVLLATVLLGRRYEAALRHDLRARPGDRS